MKRFLVAICLLMLAFGTSARADATSQSGSYTTSVFFVEDCDLGVGVVCFSVFAREVGTLHITVDDLSPFPITAQAEVYGPGDVLIGDQGQFCESADMDMGGQDVATVIVRVGGFMNEECGPLQIVDPIEGGTGWFTPATAGTVTITY
ncbi:MAG TPA: hypothetical protein VGB64_02865 [Actinomycetota bacterium]